MVGRIGIVVMALLLTAALLSTPPASATKGQPGRRCSGSETLRANPVVKLTARSISRIRASCAKAHAVARAVLKLRVRQGERGGCSDQLLPGGRSCAVQVAGRIWRCEGSEIDGDLIGCTRARAVVFYVGRDYSTG